MRNRTFECFECKKKLTEGKTTIGEFKILETPNIKYSLGTIHFCSWRCLGIFARKKEALQ